MVTDFDIWLRIYNIDDERVYFLIENQTGLLREMFKHKSSNVAIVRSSTPEVREGTEITFFVQGSDPSADWRGLRCSREVFNRILVALRALIGHDPIIKVGSLM